MTGIACLQMFRNADYKKYGERKSSEVLAKECSGGSFTHVSAELRSSHLSNGIISKQRRRNIRLLISGDFFHKQTCHLPTRVGTKSVLEAVAAVVMMASLQKTALNFFCCSQEFRKADNCLIRIDLQDSPAFCSFCYGCDLIQLINTVIVILYQNKI